MKSETWNSHRDENDPTLGDYKKARDIVNLFFDDYITPNISKRKWNMCISIARRGSQIYEDQLLSKPRVRQLFNITSKKIESHEATMRDSSILIFDDSIKTGESIRKVLGPLEFPDNNITVAVLLAREDTIADLIDEFPGVTFKHCISCNKKNFSKLYLTRISPYLHSICLPIQKNNPTLLVEFNDDFKTEDLFATLRYYGNVEIDEECIYRRIYDDRLKGSFMFRNEEHLYSLPIFSYLKRFNLVNSETDLISNIKVRFYLRKGDVKILIFQPFILEVQEDGDVRKTASFIRKQFLCEFLINKIIIGFIKSNDSVMGVYLNF